MLCYILFKTHAEVAAIRGHRPSRENSVISSRIFFFFYLARAFKDLLMIFMFKLQELVPVQGRRHTEDGERAKVQRQVPPIAASPASWRREAGQHANQRGNPDLRHRESAAHNFLELGGNTFLTVDRLRLVSLLTNNGSVTSLFTLILWILIFF